MAISNREDNGQEPDFANDNNTLLLTDSGLKNDTVPTRFVKVNCNKQQYLMKDLMTNIACSILFSII